MGFVIAYPLLKIAPENGKSTEKELLTHWFGTNHGAFGIGNHVIHLVVFVGAQGKNTVSAPSTHCFSFFMQRLNSSDSRCSASQA